ncbi:hypothetical protein, partial [Nocardia terpenica]|uniref:hypothetical protein n=1 Tax=Nocardia terpenica TaxID=455432 RepID=UPI001E644A34
MQGSDFKLDVAEASAGGKAWGLGLLRGAGFRVPEWVVVEGRVFGGLGGGLVSEVEGFVGEVELGAALRR